MLIHTPKWSGFGTVEINAHFGSAAVVNIELRGSGVEHVLTITAFAFIRSGIMSVYFGNTGLTKTKHYDFLSDALNRSVEAYEYSSSSTSIHRRIHRYTQHAAELAIYQVL